MKTTGTIGPPSSARSPAKPPRPPRPNPEAPPGSSSPRSSGEPAGRPEAPPPGARPSRTGPPPPPTRPRRGSGAVGTRPVQTPGPSRAPPKPTRPDIPDKHPDHREPRRNQPARIYRAGPHQRQNRPGRPRPAGARPEPRPAPTRAGQEKPGPGSPPYIEVGKAPRGALAPARPHCPHYPSVPAEKQPTGQNPGEPPMKPDPGSASRSPTNSRTDPIAGQPVRSDRSPRDHRGDQPGRHHPEPA